MTALPMLLPLRAITSNTTPVARPVIPLNIAHTNAPAIANGTRLVRSASCAIGTCNAKAATDANATKPNTFVLLRLKSSRMLGNKMAKAVRSNSSTAFRPNNTTSGNAASPPHTPRNHVMG